MIVYRPRGKTGEGAGDGGHRSNCSEDSGPKAHLYDSSLTPSPPWRIGLISKSPFTSELGFVKRSYRPGIPEIAWDSAVWLCSVCGGRAWG